MAELESTATGNHRQPTAEEIFLVQARRLQISGCVLAFLGLGLTVVAAFVHAALYGPGVLLVLSGAACLIIGRRKLHMATRSTANQLEYPQPYTAVTSSSTAASSSLAYQVSGTHGIVNPAIVQLSASEYARHHQTYPPQANYPAQVFVNSPSPPSYEDATRSQLS